MKLLLFLKEPTIAQDTFRWAFSEKIICSYLNIARKQTFFNIFY